MHDNKKVGKKASKQYESFEILTQTPTQKSYHVQIFSAKEKAFSQFMRQTKEGIFIPPFHKRNTNSKNWFRHQSPDTATSYRASNCNRFQWKGAQKKAEKKRGETTGGEERGGLGMAEEEGTEGVGGGSAELGSHWRRRSTTEMMAASGPWKGSLNEEWPGLSDLDRWIALVGCRAIDGSDFVPTFCDLASNK